MYDKQPNFYIHYYYQCVIVRAVGQHEPCCVLYITL